MNRTTLMILFALPLLTIACASKRSEVATKLGYEKSSKVQAGPYQLHYGQRGSEEFLLLSQGNWNILSRYGAEGTHVFRDGDSFINFERNPDGSLTNLSMRIPDVHGKSRITLIDKDVDGQWDLKIDLGLHKTFVWKDGRWVERHQSQQDGPADGNQPSRVDTNRTPGAAGSRR